MKKLENQNGYERCLGSWNKLRIHSPKFNLMLCNPDPLSADLRADFGLSLVMTRWRESRRKHKWK